MIHIIDLVPWIVAVITITLMVVESTIYVMPTKTCRTISFGLVGILVVYVLIKMFGDV